jgi:hypothetical protein
MSLVCADREDARDRTVVDRESFGICDVSDLGE